MKRGLLILPLVVLMLPVIVGCNGGVQGTTATETIDTATVTIDSDTGTTDLLHVSTLPSILFFEGENYEIEGYETLEPSEITDFIGYWINAEDLKKWQEYDDDEDIVYVIQEENRLYHFSYTGELSNRFQLYWTVNDDQIAVFDSGTYRPYQKVPRD